MWQSEWCLPLLIVSRIGWLTETYGLKITQADLMLLSRIAQRIYALCNGLSGLTADEVICNLEKCLLLMRVP